MAKTATIGAFFVLAMTAGFSGVPVFDCALRAVVGAAAVYVLLRFAGEVTQWLVRTSGPPEQPGDTGRQKGQS